MAIIRPSEVISGISGDVGGLNFATSRSSTYVRIKGRRTRNTSITSTRQRANYAKATVAWSEKTDAERNAWRVAASQITFANRLAVQRSISAYQLFVKLFLITIDEDVQQPNPPALFPSSPLENPTLEFRFDTDYHWEADNIFPALGPDAHTYGARSFTTSPVERSSHWKLLKVARLGFAEQGNHFKDEWNAKLGLPAIGERVGARFFIRERDTMPGFLYELWTNVIPA